MFYMGQEKGYRMVETSHKLKVAGFNPLDIMITGATGAGKSTTLNSIFKREVAVAGHTHEPETMDIASYSFNENIRLWDTPGLGDGTNDIAHSKKIKNLLQKSYNGNNGWIDLVLIIVNGSTRDLGTARELINEVIIPNFPGDKIMIAINQADRAMKTRGWCRVSNTPAPKLLNYLETQSDDIQSRIRKDTGVSVARPIFYSAEYGYNVTKLYDLIIDNIPNQRRVL